MGPLSVNYNGAEYFYLKNAQGDVTGIVNAAGTQVVAYTYDAWGKLLSTTGTMAGSIGTLNPFRYRGYVYDTETGLYYLNSRYYNPETGRFINADSYASTGQGIIGNNMFAYCGNNPNTRTDQQGTFFKEIGGLFKKFVEAIKTLLPTETKVQKTIMSEKRSYLGGIITIETGTTTTVSSPTNQKAANTGASFYTAAAPSTPTETTVGMIVKGKATELDVHLGITDTGYTYSYDMQDTKIGMGSRVDFSDFRTGLMLSATTSAGEYRETTNYIYASVDGWTVATVLVFSASGLGATSAGTMQFVPIG